MSTIPRKITTNPIKEKVKTIFLNTPLDGFTVLLLIAIRDNPKVNTSTPKDIAHKKGKIKQIITIR